MQQLFGQTKMSQLLTADPNTTHADPRSRCEIANSKWNFLVLVIFYSSFFAISISFMIYLFKLIEREDGRLNEWLFMLKFKRHKQRLLENPKRRENYSLLNPESELSLTLMKARLKRGWTQTELAQQVNMQQPNIARLERGNYDRVSLATLKRIAKALGVRIVTKFVD
jgi:DNA-binding Xre family transcriptional regulator